MILNDAVAERIMKIYEDMYMKGELLSQAQLTMYYQTFQAKFGRNNWQVWTDIHY